MITSKLQVDYNLNNHSYVLRYFECIMPIKHFFGKAVKTVVRTIYDLHNLISDSYVTHGEILGIY